MVIKLHVQQIYLDAIKSGKKKIEGRLGKKKYLDLKHGDVILFNDEVAASVHAVRHYSSFSEMLEKEGLERVLPGVSSVERGCAIYHEFYSKDDEMSYGVSAIELYI